MACGNYRDKTRAFQLQDSTIRKICKAALPEKSERHQGFKGGKVWNTKGAGLPLSYPASIDEELLSWLLIMNDLHLPVSILALQKKAKSLILPHNPCFEASRGWVRQFKKRHNLALRKKKHLCVKNFHPNLKVKYHHSECTRFLKIGKYPLLLIANMDQTPVFFDMVPEKSLMQKGQMSVKILVLRRDTGLLSLLLQQMDLCYHQ